MAELDNSALINDLLSGLLLEEVEQNVPVEPKGLMSSKTGTNTSADAAAAEAELQPKSGRASITEFIQKLSAADTPNEGESGGTLGSVNYLTMDDMYRKYNTPLYKLGSLNRDTGSDEDAAALKVKRNTNFGDAYLDSLGAAMDKSDTNSKRESILSEGKASTLFDRKAAEDLASTFLEGLQDKYQEKRINPNVKSLPEQDSFAVTELDDAVVGGASDGKVDEGLMSRPEAEEQYDKEAMLEINEPKGRGIEVNKYSKMMLDGATEKEKLKGIQGILTKLGYKPKGIDGKMGGGTRRALRKLQFMSGIEVNADNSVKSISDIDAATMQALNSTDMKVFPDPPKTDAPVTAFTDADFKIFSDEVGQIESTNNYGIKGGFNNHYLGRYQMGKDALGDTGRKYNTRLNSEFLRNPALQDKLFKKYTLKNHKHLTVNSGKYRDMSNTEKLGILGYAHNQGATAAEEYLVTGIVGTDAFNTKATKYTKAIGNAFRKLQPFAAGAR